MRISEAIQQVVAIYPGRFHPFHKGHASVYEYLKAKYKNVYIATSDKVAPPKSPFTFAEKKMMMVHAGVPANAIVQTKNPYQAQEILENFDPASTAVVFAVSQKDMDEDPRFSFNPKKDGSPSDFQPMGKDLATFDKHGYITTVPTLDFNVLDEPMRSATQLRAIFAKADDKTQKQMIIDLYGQYDANIHNVMQSKITEFHDMEQDYNRIQEVAKRIWALDVQRPLSEDVKQTAISNIKLATEAWKNRYTKQYNEALSLPPEADAKWMEKNIRDSAKKAGIDPNVAVRVWKSEGGMSYQSQVPRKGKGSMGGKEASYGPFQLYTGGGLGNDYENEYGVDLTKDNNLPGLKRQMDFAMSKASQVGWGPWYGAAKAGIVDRDGIDAPFNVKRRKVSTTSPDSKSDFGTAFKKARAKHGGAGGKFSYKGKEYQTNVKGEKYVTNPVSVDEADVKPHGDFELDDIAPELRPAVRQAMVRFPMAKDRISAVIRMMQQDSNRQQKNIKNIDRLDTENDIQDVEIDSSENDITNLKNRIANLEKRLASVKESMIKEKVDLDEMTLAKLKGKIFGKIMSDDKKEKLQQMIKDKGIAAVAKMFGLSNRELEAIAESKEGMVKEVTIDNKNGRGAVSNNQEVDYFGMRVNMKPSTFIALASKLGKDPEPEMIDYIKKGGAIGSPFLSINSDETGEKAEVTGHEGRNRMLAIMKAEGDVPVEVHLFFNSDQVNRARHLTPELVSAIKQELISQDDNLVKGPLWEGVGRIVKGVNTTPDVGVNQTKIEAAKLNIKVDKDGRPPVLERGSIGVPLSSGLTVNVAPHRELKIKKSTKGRLNYENPKKPKRRKST